MTIKLKPPISDDDMVQSQRILDLAIQLEFEDGLGITEAEEAIEKVMASTLSAKLRKDEI
jgi:hypothetical protein